MNVEGKKVLVLGGWGLVGHAVCREILDRRPQRLIVHSLRPAEAEEAQKRLLRDANGAEVMAAHGDVFDVAGESTDRERMLAQLKALDDGDLEDFRLYRLLRENEPDIVIDCINTATGIAYRDVFHAVDGVLPHLDAESVPVEAVEDLLSALYIPRLIRHIQVLYRGMVDARTRVYLKVGTSGTGGMGLNIPYTHSEEKPSRMLLSKSALAGAQSLLLFLMARTPGAPITKEIKPAAAIAWKAIEHGPIRRRGEPLRRIDAHPRPLGSTFSTVDSSAAKVRDEIIETVYIDTGENGIFSLEEFAALTTARQMEFVTPEEIAQYLVFEIEGGNTGHDVINALDNAVLGPTYRAGLMRHWALERMNALQKEHGTSSVAFEMLGPPRVTKLLFEAHLLRCAFKTMTTVRKSSAEEVQSGLESLLRKSPEIANEVAAVGIPILLPSGEIIRGPKVIIPGDADNVPVTPDLLERWVHDGWVDLRLPNCQRWIERFAAIHREVGSIPPGDTSSRYLRTERFWDEAKVIQPGKIVGWILSGEEHGARLKR